jgi:hypothetical protein
MLLADSITDDPTKITFVKMDHTGDTKLIFDPNNPDEVEAARNTFRDLKKKGFIAYRVSADGAKGEIIREFDQAAGKIILAPAMQGG